MSLSLADASGYNGTDADTRMMMEFTRHVKEAAVNLKTPQLSRRRLLQHSAAALSVVGMSRRSWGRSIGSADIGVVVGEATGQKIGMQVLADGGNAVDAIVAAALVATVASPAMTGIGGYGMTAVIAADDGRKIVAIDGNTVAPAAMPADLFQQPPVGKLPDGFSSTDSNSSIGWLSAGVPGILAGLQLALDHFGTRGFAEVVKPAIALARDGIPWTESLASSVGDRRIFRSDSGSGKLFFPAGKPLSVGERFRNPDLAAMLSELANANSVEAFYRGDIAQCIADGFQKNGGLVTTQDLASYGARLVEPLKMTRGQYSIYTAPLTAGGLSILQMLLTLQAMNWDQLPVGLLKTHARIEAMRLAWRDRLSLLGDPEFSDAPVTRLMSEDYARDSAERIMAAVQAGKPLAHAVTRRPHTGTIHLSAADRHGNFAALTLTHGNTFGACVTVDGLGLTLGHGMSRFDPDPCHPNAPGPGKRPLHNMVPTIVTRDGKPVLAVGGTGGRKIPNGLFEVLTNFVVLDQSMKESIAAPRLHTEGDMALAVEKAWPAEETTALRNLGYTVTNSGGATMSAVALENGEFHQAKR